MRHGPLSDTPYFLKHQDLTCFSKSLKNTNCLDEKGKSYHCDDYLHGGCQWQLVVPMQNLKRLKLKTQNVTLELFIAIYVVFLRNVDVSRADIVKVRPRSKWLKNQNIYWNKLNFHKWKLNVYHQMNSDELLVHNPLHFLQFSTCWLREKWHKGENFYFITETQ